MAHESFTPILHQPGDCINQRYTVVRRLGAGAMGEVYLVTDVERGRLPVAMKYLLGQSPTALDRFKREFSTLAHLHHPNITAVHDLELDRHHRVHFFTTEFVVGAPFDQAAQQLPLAQLIDLFVQSLRALAYLHGHGLLHYDIKGANLLVTTGDEVMPQAKLIDFGVADHGWHGKRRGTPSYMAPEVVDARHADHRADLYSLGVVMYLALTNWNPFRGGTREITYDRQRTFQPPPPSSRNPAVPAYIDQIVLRLLEKRPEDRYSNATEALHDLNRLGPAPFAIETPDTLHSYVPESGPFVARDLERTVLESLLTHPSDGSAPVQPICWIRGGRGTGKTRLLREAKWLAQLHDYSTCYIDPQRPDAAAELSATLAQIEAAAPDHRYWIGIDEAHDIPPTPEWKNCLRRLHHFLRTSMHQHLLCDATHYHPVVLVLASAGTKAAGDQVGAQLGVQQNETQLLGLGNFTRSELTQYLSTCTGIADVPPPLIDLMWRYSEGNPFYVTELLKTLIREGRLFDAAGRWQATTFADLGLNFDRLTLPATITAAVAHDFARLPPPQQRLLGLMATWEHPVPLADLRTALAEPIAAHWLADLVQNGFLTFDPDVRCYTFRALSHRQAIYQLLSAAERAHWHDRIAHCLATQDKTPARIWWHQAHGRDPELAQQARWRLALYNSHHERVADALTLCEAYRSASPGPAPLAVGLLQARLLARVRRGPEAIAWLAGLIDNAASPAARIALHETLASLTLKARDFPQARTAIARALQLQQTHYPADDALRLRLTNAETVIGMFEQKAPDALDAAIRQFRTTAQAAAQLPDTARARITNNDLGYALMLFGNFVEAIRTLQTDLHHGQQLASTRDITRTMGLLAECYRQTRKPAEAADLCTRALQLAQTEHDPERLMYLYTTLGNIEEQRGTGPAAIAAYERALDLTHRVGDPHRALTLTLNLGILHRQQHDSKRAEGYLLSTIGFYNQHAASSGVDAHCACQGHLELAELYRLRGRFGLAHQHVDIAHTMASEHGSCQSLQFYIVATKIEIHRDAGEADQARSLSPLMHQLATTTNLTSTASEIESSIAEESTIG